MPFRSPTAELRFHLDHVAGFGQVAATDRFAEATGETVDAILGEAARLCALNVLTHLRTACAGDLDRVRRVVQLRGFVNCTPDFTDMPQVVNGASDLMVEIFGDAGRHARAAVGHLDPLRRLRGVQERVHGATLLLIIM